MPTYQTIIVDITPGAKEKPVLNASQFDNGRPFNVALAWDSVPFTDAGDFDIEIHVKKPDGNIVTAEPDSVVNEVCTFLTTEQMCACHGLNECEIVLFDNDIQIGTGNFILDVEKAPDEGGIQSASEIANLATQIDAITLEYLINNTDEIAEIIANKIYPTLEASGDIATFNTILQLPLVSVDADPLATIITRCGKNFLDYENADNISSGATYSGGVYTYPQQYAVVEWDIPVKQGNYVASVNIPEINGSTICLEISNNDGTPFDVRSYITVTGVSSKTFTITDQTSIKGSVWCSIYSGTAKISSCQLELGSTASTYEPYNGITKPIAEATTIPTLTGINNVFTDYGPVTVDYKYFPDI